MPALAAGVIALLSAGGMSAPEAADRDVLVLLSRESESFRKAEAAASTRLARAKMKVTTALIGEVKPDDTKDTIITIGTEAAQWARDNAPSTATIVACLVADAQGAGLTVGRVVHGVQAEITPEEQLALIDDVLPEGRKIGVLCNPDSSRGRRMLDALRNAAGTRWTIEVVDVRKPDEFADAIDTLIKRGVDLIWTMPDSSLYTQSTIRTLLQSTLRAKVPVFGFSVPLVKAGALMGMGIEPGAQGEQAADLAVELASKPSQERRTVSSRYEIAINFAVAKQIGVRIPSAAASRATHKFTGE